MKRGGILIIAMLMLPGFALAQATGTGNITVQVVQAISITTVTDLDFGVLSVGSVGGTVTLQPTAGGGCIISETGDVDQGSGATTATCAEFEVTGAANAWYSVTLPSSVTISDGGTNTMTVDNFQACSMTAANCSYYYLDGSGEDQLIVGARLNVNGGQAQGTYTGTFSVTVEYTP